MPQTVHCNKMSAMYTKPSIAQCYILTDWEDFNAGTDQSTFKCTLSPLNPHPLFNRKVSKQTCEHFFHLWVVRFTVCQLYTCDTLVPSSSFQKTRDAETKKQFWG